jgi:methylmalonyl-CoA mutase N-terminal domain/subunit
MAGSYYIEALTDTIEEQVWKYLKRIDRMGGAMAAIEKGYFQEEIRNSAYRLKKEIDGNSRVIVGVNKFHDAQDVEPALNRIDPEIEKKQLARLQEFKSGRDMTKVNGTLAALQKAAEKDENLMPLIINGVKSYATLGEISGTLTEVFGRYEAKTSF